MSPCCLPWPTLQSSRPLHWALDLENKRGGQRMTSRGTREAVATLTLSVLGLTLALWGPGQALAESPGRACPRGPGEPEIYLVPSGILAMGPSLREGPQ